MVKGLAAIDHVVVVMLENRSFDHMLGFLYDETTKPPRRQAFEGLTGTESCPDASGKPVPVSKITPQTPNAYLMPGADPGEGYAATNDQLFGADSPPPGAVATNQGFVTNYVKAIAANKAKKWPIVTGTAPEWIMGCYTPEALPVLSALARGYAVCDHWYSSVPTMTLPNRAFACAATSQGHLDDQTKTFTVPTIFGRLTDAKLAWKIYGYTDLPLTRLDFPDIKDAPRTQFGKFTDFTADAAAGTLPAYAFLEPSWSSTGNSQHPNYDVALGEQFLLDIYQTLHTSPAWAKTLLIITYDEHGGCYDHVPPPGGAAKPDTTVGEHLFDFTRFGVRVPTVLVSPLIEAGTVFRVPDNTTPLDHTSILATVEHRWKLKPLTKRDAAAPDVGAVLTLTTARTDDPLAGVTAPPPSTVPTKLATEPTHLQKVHADLAAALIGDDHTDGEPPLGLKTGDEYEAYIRDRTQHWLSRREAERLP